MRWIIRLAAFTCVAVLAYLAVTFVQVYRASHLDQAHAVDAIVVLGAAQYNGRPSPVLRARLDHAIALFHRGDGRFIVVTGGRQPGDSFTEATSSADYLIAHGIADSVILREVTGRTSWQSLASASSFLKSHDPPLRLVLLVSDPFHSARVAAISRELGLVGYVSPTRTSPITGVRAVPYLAKETVAMAVGRIIGFRREAGVDGRLQRVRTSQTTG
jgi:uncharacterized SAM-binding protein YcdF (DUF218 family)